ncbi:MAG: hypothetical protein LBU84_12750 [Prevotella sp.]|jgi:hypothetical protein|nr:hypothetical protein [Prevotella sp.]
MKKYCFFILLALLTITQTVQSQSRFSLTPGIYYNGTGFNDDVYGFGLIMGLEYMQHKSHFFSIELRTRYGYYKFDDGTSWTENNEGELLPPKNPNEPRLEYSLFNPQVGIVPKFHLHLDESMSLFLENEISVGLMSGNFKYNDQDYVKKSFTEVIYSYNIGVGVEYTLNKLSLVGSVGYSTLNFRSKIKEHQPEGYKGWIPNQNAGLLVNFILKIPL